MYMSNGKNLQDVNLYGTYPRTWSPEMEKTNRYYKM
uniref:Uncharacterized protein n=1 Tax=Arundo donax TaxID=35708 RepID=A0A0A9B876_ARUDO